MTNEQLDTEEWTICKEAANRVVDALNKEINAIHDSRHEKNLPPFVDTVLIITAIFSSYSLLKLKSMSSNNKDEEISQLFTHFCKTVFDLVNTEYWEFDYEH